MTDAGNADFLLPYHVADTEEAVDIGLGIAPMAGISPGRDDQALAFIHPQSGDRNTDQVGGFADGIKNFMAGSRIGLVLSHQSCLRNLYLWQQISCPRFLA
jgi:hypothetical protein